MAKPPGIIDKANYIVNFAEHPCHAPWTVYLELAIPALGEVLLSVLEINDPWGIIANYFRPKGLRAAAHGRRKKRRGKHKLSLPDTEELVADHIPFGEAIRARKVSNGVRYLWIFEGVLERLFWYWFIVETTEDFFYNWCSAVAKSEYCSKQGQLGCHADGQGGALSEGNPWTNYGPATADWVEGGVVYGGASVFVPEPGHALVGTATFDNNTGHGASLDLAWFYGDEGPFDIQQSNPDPGQSEDLITTVTADRVGTWTMKARVTGYLLYAGNTTIDCF